MECNRLSWQQWPRRRSAQRADQENLIRPYLILEMLKLLLLSLPLPRLVVPIHVLALALALLVALILLVLVFALVRVFLGWFLAGTRSAIARSAHCWDFD